jgi:hypothetical protein
MFLESMRSTSFPAAFLYVIGTSGSRADSPANWKIGRFRHRLLKQNRLQSQATTPTPTPTYSAVCAIAHEKNWAVSLISNVAQVRGPHAHLNAI